MPPQPTSTTFLIIPLILNSIHAPPQPMANAREQIVYQLSNNQRHDDLDSNQFSWLPPAGLCSGHFGIANTTESSVLLLLVVSLPEQQGDLPARHGHGHLGSNNTNTKVPWTSLPLEPGTYGVPRLGSADRFGLNFSLDVGLYSLSESSSLLFPTPPMTMSEQVGAPALFGWVLCHGDGNGSFIPAFFQDDPHDRRYKNEATTYRRRYRKRVRAAQAQPRKLLSGDTRNFHGGHHRPALVPNKTPVHTYSYTAAAIAMCFALLAIVCTVAGLLLWCMRSTVLQEDDETSIRLLPDDLCPAGPRRYSHQELAAATGGFPDEGMIGRGGFGPVYRGYLRDRGCHAAMKVLSSMQAQGMREFQAEVKVMTRLRHRNIVQLLGWSCSSDDGPGRRIMLVYEFLPNGSLDKRLHNPQGPLLAWADRYKIALGVGSAILYLHTECEQCVLHGDIKPANILLDASCNAKLGDFGLARLVDHGADSRTTQVVAGTPGYMDPELVNSGRPSAEVDVFSFGVVLLELACGRRPTAGGAAHQPNTLLLIDWVRDMYHKNAILGAADRRLDAEFDRQQMRRVLVAGLWCTHHDQSQRPTIAQAMDLLRRQGAELPIFSAEMQSPAAASVRSLEEIAYGDLDLSAEDSGFEDSSADTAYHTSEVSTLEC